MAGRSRNNPDQQPSETEGLLPADYDLADLYGAQSADEDPDDTAVLIPPITLPSDAELAAAALAVPLVARVVALARWIAPHREVDEHGDLGPEDRVRAARMLGAEDPDEDDVVEAMRAWALACDLDLVETGTTDDGAHVAIPGPDLAAVEAGEPAAVLGLWFEAAELVRELAAEAESVDPELVEGGGSDDSAGLAEVEDARDQAAEILDEALHVLYETTAFAEPGAETVPLGVLAALLVVPDGEEPDEEMLGEITDLMVVLDPMLGDLAELGLVEHRPIDPDLFEEGEGEPAAEAVDTDRPLTDEDAARFGTVRLTALGQYAVREWLLADGYDAPLIGDLADQDGAALLRALADGGQLFAEPELRAWTAARAPRDAARELLAGARGRDPQSPVRRYYCVLGLGELDEAAAEEVALVVDDPELGGLAREWLRARGADVTAAERDVALWRVIDSMAAVMLISAGEGGRLRALVADLPVTDNPASYFGEVWRVPHPMTAEVLEAVGELHLDRKVAKEARRAALKARSLRGQGGGR
ncbi:MULTISPECIES: hypothetical protein [Kitasatospora]|uniref:Uncharacterized protein n=1 Tax=Kitasatospora setae (strain ATCC 33774 / DSM 43861 / JCM 3304 / KCC A-0304 / NBRC 14216 / KM-6054) TaxID=452652 RepID=E4N017_KITSK|nr:MULTISPECIES: hypothetical protein [Kitasatospora]BAJ31345.1 hypothetical protein KSE_55700 [Kitasatospora setae KM-6054]